MYSDYTYTVTTTGLDSSSPADAATVATILAGMMVFMIIAVVIGYVISSFLLSRIFKKAGVKQSIAWIPIYNVWKILELGDQKGFWAPLMLVPGVNIASIIFMYIAMHNIGKKFGKPDWFIALAILLPPVWYIILAFDKSQWNGGISTETVSANTNTQPTPAVEEPYNNSQPAPISEPTETPAPAPYTTQPTEPVAPTVEGYNQPTDTPSTPPTDTV